MTEFTPLSATLGGILIGASAVMLMLFNGRIAGISGVMSGALFSGPRGERAWKAAFLVGLVAAPALYTLALDQGVPVTFESGWPTVALAGGLVGFGTRLGSGCTSGHGVCGLSRLSPRSTLSVAVFMLAGMITVGLLRGVPAQ